MWLNACEIVSKHDIGMRLCEGPDYCSGHGTMTSSWVVVPERSQIYRMWAYPLVVSRSNLSLLWDDRLIPG